MPAFTIKENQRQLSDARFWQRAAQSAYPVLGALIRRIALVRLKSAAASGSRWHAQSLAELAVEPKEPELRQAVIAALKSTLPPSAWNGVWAAWRKSRSASLLELLLSRGKHASQPEEERVYSLLVLGELSQLYTCTANSVPALISAFHDQDESIRAAARTVLLRIKRQDAYSALCQAWSDTRDAELGEILASTRRVPEKPIRVRVLTALKFHHLGLLSTSGPEIIPDLIAALHDTDPEISAAAHLCLRNLKNQTAIDELCRLWSIARSQELSDVITHAHYSAQQPLQLRVLTLLKIGKLDVAANLSGLAVPFLLAASHDQDIVISENANTVLHSLKTREMQTALCLAAALNDDPAAASISIDCGYLPDLIEEQALYYFLTGQFQAYDELDFDLRILRVYYAAAPEEIRQKIARKIQTSGKIQYIAILTGQEGVHSAQKMSSSEIEVTFRALVSARDWPHLWRWVFSFPLPTAIEALKILSDSQWLPSGSEMPVFVRLRELVGLPLPDFHSSWFDGLPLAIPLAYLNLRGRINDVAFSPTSTLLAIGTNQGKVALWDYQKGVLEHVISGFKHSVSNVVFSENNSLLIGEKTSRTDSPCKIYIYTQGTTAVLGQHQGTVISLDVFNGNLLVSAGRDNQVNIWNLDTHQQIAQSKIPFWPRSVSLSAKASQLLLCHDRVYTLNLPGLDQFHEIRSSGIPSKAGYPSYSLIQCSLQLPQSSAFITGHFNGNIILWQQKPNSPAYRRSLITRFDQRVIGVDFVPNHDLIISSSAAGDLLFLSQDSLKPVQHIPSAVGKLTSMHVSADGSFLATGTSDSQMVLWDLRTLDLPAAISQPIAAIPHWLLPAVQALAKSSQVPLPVSTALQILTVLLQTKFQYDILVSDQPQIHAGQFDILVE